MLAGAHTLLIYTIGHSDHTIPAFVDLLCKFDVALLVDVRSQPYSRWMPQFNREDLAHDLQEAGIDYISMGDSLGGRPADPALYDPGAERPDYGRMAQTPGYQNGIAQLLDLARAQHVVVMCSEGDYHQCHRHKLITQTLLERGIDVQHIQPDGTTAAGEIIPQQLSLF